VRVSGAGLCESGEGVRRWKDASERVGASIRLFGRRNGGRGCVCVCLEGKTMLLACLLVINTNIQDTTYRNLKTRGILITRQ